MKSGENCSLISLKVSEKKMCKDFTILYMCIAQGQGKINPKILTVAK